MKLGGALGVPHFLLNLPTVNLQNEILKVCKMNLKILESNPELAKDITLQMSGEDLLSFADKLILESSKETARRLKEAAKPDVYLTRKEVAEILNVSLTTLFHWNNKGILTTRKIGNKVRYLRKDIDKVLTEK